MKNEVTSSVSLSWVLNQFKVTQSLWLVSEKTLKTNKQKTPETRMTANVLKQDRLTVTCRFVAWQRGLPRKFANCVLTNNRRETSTDKNVLDRKYVTTNANRDGLRCCLLKIKNKMGNYRNVQNCENVRKHVCGEWVSVVVCQSESKFQQQKIRIITKVILQSHLMSYSMSS